MLYLSVHTGADMRDEVFASGADELVPKPFVGKQLAEGILHHLGGPNRT
ncbi:MAG: hypothetical protein F6K25_28725 [Okeania sp. SIO2G4]|nr:MULTISPECIES: hypothetical protein [unclassified Okeania]NEP75019.1 hypothetical protein [Okeania sp. SIO2G5]NEP96103.1 hypothetical protein [Okeania sp. SIO2F5]NEQ94424.1 hypothetical protein [Okeania sp. SIO2G4]